MKFDSKEMKMGLRDERSEHLKTVNGSEKKIRDMVMAHLRKDPHYYSKINKVIKE